MSISASVLDFSIRFTIDSGYFPSSPENWALSLKWIFALCYPTFLVICYSWSFSDYLICHNTDYGSGVFSFLFATLSVLLRPQLCSKHSFFLWWLPPLLWVQSIKKIQRNVCPLSEALFKISPWSELHNMVRSQVSAKRCHYLCSYSTVSQERKCMLPLLHNNLVCCCEVKFQV